MVHAQGMLLLDQQIVSQSLFTKLHVVVRRSSGETFLVGGGRFEGILLGSHLLSCSTVVWEDTSSFFYDNLIYITPSNRP
jgi:hypothetical protein